MFKIQISPQTDHLKKRKLLQLIKTAFSEKGV